MRNYISPEEVVHIADPSVYLGAFSLQVDNLHVPLHTPHTLDERNMELKAKPKTEWVEITVKRELFIIDVV